MYDFNDAEPYHGGDLIPDGVFAKVIMILRPGGIDGPFESDQGLLRASNSSDALMLDCEFVIAEGPQARRKFWQMFVVSGGKEDEKGVSKGWQVTKSLLRAMIDSALGLDPADVSDAVRAKRQIRGLADLNGITFVAKIKIEPSRDPQYGDQNKLDRPVPVTEPEWQAVMNGETVAPKPSGRKTTPTTTQKPAAAWQQSWQKPAVATMAAPAAARTAAPAGPSWING